MSDAIVVHAPATQAKQLILLFHGVGALPDDLVPLGRHIATSFPDAAIVSVAAPDHSDFGRGHQWFSVAGVTEDNRVARIATAMPVFAQTVAAWQEHFHVGAADTTLIGFSQGAIMSLESTKQVPALAGRVVSLSGRFATLPTAAPQDTRIHFLHGESDNVILCTYATSAARQLQSLGASVTLDTIPGLGHGVNGTVANRVIERLAH